MQLVANSGKLEDRLDVCFFPETGCNHLEGGSTKGQMRGCLRGASVREAGNRKAALAHVLLAEARPLAQQLGGDISTCGGNSQVRSHPLMSLLLESTKILNWSTINKCSVTEYKQKQETFDLRLWHVVGCSD